MPGREVVGGPAERVPVVPGVHAPVVARGLRVEVVVGVNELSAGYGGDVGFAIQANLAKTVAAALIKDGKVVRGFIGAHVKDVTPRLVKRFELERRKGACVVEVGTPFWRRSPAEDAGLQAGDVVVKYGTLAIDRARPLARAVLNTKPGTKVAVEFYRGKKHLRCELKVRER